MPKVTFQNEGITIEAPSGTSIKEVADGAGVNLFEGFWGSYHCSGRGLCLGSGCRIWVLEQAPNAISPRTIWEKIRPTQKGSIRLACQAEVRGDVAIRTQPGASLENKPNMKWDPDPRPSKWKDRLGGGTGGEKEDDAEDAKASTA